MHWPYIGKTSYWILDIGCIHVKWCFPCWCSTNSDEQWFASLLSMWALAGHVLTSNGIHGSYSCQTTQSCRATSCRIRHPHHLWILSTVSLRMASSSSSCTKNYFKYFSCAIECVSYDSNWNGKFAPKKDSFRSVNHLYKFTPCMLDLKNLLFWNKVMAKILSLVKFQMRVHTYSSQKQLSKRKI